MNPDPPFDDPVAISDYMLEITEGPVLRGDFDALAPHFLLPQIIGSDEGDQRVQTREELRAVVMGAHAAMHKMGAIGLMRRTIAARFLAADEIQSTFVARYILPGNLLTTAVVAHGRLKRDAGRWKIAEHRYAVDGAPELSRALSSAATRYRDGAATGREGKN